MNDSKTTDRQTIVPWIVGIVLLLAVATFFFWSSFGRPETSRGIGQHLGFLKLEPLTGNPPPLSSADLQGRVLLLNFWGPWCPHCLTELPHMAALYARFADREDFRLAAISYPAGGEGDVATLREDTAAALKRLGVDLPTYYDPDDKTQAAVARLIDFLGVPTSVLVDRHGVIRAIWAGYEPGFEQEMQEHVDKLLSENYD